MALAYPCCSDVKCASISPFESNLVRSRMASVESGYSIPFNSTNGNVPSLERTPKGAVHSIV